MTFHNQYLVCAILIKPKDLKQIRKTLNKLLLPGQRELHFHKEKPSKPATPPR